MKKYTITVVMAALLLTACDNTTELRSFQEEERVALEITSNIGMAETTTTRASDVSWANGDQIGVYAMKTTETTPIVGGSNVPYSTTVTTATATGTSPNYTYAPATFTATPPIYLPANGAAIKVFAYYPYNSSANLDPTAVPIVVSSQSSLPSIDFMRAMNDKTTIDGSTAITKANKSTQLLFYHKLSKVVFTLVAGTGMQSTDLTDASTTVTLIIGGQPTAATYNIYTDAISITSGSNEITAHETTKGVTYEAILLPNGENNTAADRACTLTIGTAVYNFTIPSTKSFVAGQQTNYELTVNATGLDIKAAIQPWNSLASVGLTAQ